MKDRTDRGYANQLNDLPYLLPTPVASPPGGTPENHLRKKPGRGQVTDLAMIIENDLLETGGKLLPTPDAYAGTRGGTQHPDKRRAGGHAVSVADVVEHDLLPTPAVADIEGGRKHRSGARSDGLLLNGIADAELFGKYAGAIARWARTLGRPAPEPTEPGTKPGKRRLSAKFVEWMMGQPEGRVTDPELGLSRTQQIKALGNGVVTQQAEIALGRLMERMPR